MAKSGLGLVNTKFESSRPKMNKQGALTHADGGIAAPATRRTFLLASAALGIIGATRAVHPVAGTLANVAPALTWPTDGWRIADPAGDGMDPYFLSQLDAWVVNETPLLSALLVVHDGAIVFENYYNGLTWDQPFFAWSVAKSVTGIGVGIALREGLLPGLGLTLGELIPERIPAGADPRVPGITVEHLLTMTAGWEWDGRINFQRHAETDDLDFDLMRTMVFDPGACFEYDNGCSNLLSYIIQSLSGETMADYLQPRLFDPLGIARPAWLTTEDGATRGAGGMELTARDLAKLGYLFLRGGQWDEARIVDEEWVASSTRVQSSGTSDMTGANISYGSAYGYHWWVRQTAGYPAYYASGYGGQLVYVVPDFDLVVVTGVTPIAAYEPERQQSPVPCIDELIVPAVLY